jgi:phosphoribosylformylglycinamidine synthase PurS subunit
VQVRVYITPKQGVLDPQGRAIEQSLRTLGFANIGQVRMGKYIVLDIAAGTPADAEAEVKRICEQLLANTVIEDYRFEVEGA